MQGKTNAFFMLQRLKAELPHIMVKGIDGLSRAVIQKTEQGGRATFKIFVEGDNMLSAMGVRGTIPLPRRTKDLGTDLCSP